MPGNEHRDIESDKGQELLDELGGIREGLTRLAAAVEDTNEILSEATGIELVDEDEDDQPETDTGAALREMGSIFIDAFKSNMGRSRRV